LNIRRFLYKVRQRIHLQFIKQSWVNIKKDKAKAFFAVFGIMVSIILLTAIGMVNDTMSYNYMGLITSSTGASDIMISKSVKTDLTFDPFFHQDIIENDLQNIEGVEELFPRIMMLARASSEKSTRNGTLFFYGINFLAEYANGHMGDLKIVDDNGKETGTLYDGAPTNGECVILWKVAGLLNLSINDFIHLEYQQYDLDLKVIAICIQDQKFTEFENTLVIVNINQAQTFLNRLNEINFVMGTIKNPQSVYDVRDLESTKNKLKLIGTNIQVRLNPNEYSVSMPKLEQLTSEEFLLVIMTIIFWFITVISVLITGILINSILSTSTEERMREYGILRVVGGKKNFPVKMVIFEGVLIGIIGSILGIIIGWILTPPIVNGLFIATNFRLQNVEYVIQPSTIILAFSIGSLVSLAVSLLPALKTGRLDIVKSITPFHKKEEGWEIKKEGSVNVKSFLVGISIATIGMVVFILLPNIIVTGEFMLIAGLFIGLLCAILIGLVFASVGIIPIIGNLFLSIITPTIRRYANIIKVSLKRNKRRNTSTIILFAISFSFIFFITSVTEMESQNMSLNLRFQYGTDLILINQGLEQSGNSVTVDMIEQLNQYPGIEKMAITLYNMFDITSILSVAYDFSEGGGFFDEEAINEAFTNIFEFYSEQRESKYHVTAGDLAAFDELEIGFIGVEEDFYELIDKDLLIWSSPHSNFDYSVSELFSHNNTCIIAESLATVLGIDDVGEQIRLTFYNPQVQNDPGNITLFTVAGISGGIPGFYNFKSSQASAEGSGIMVSLDNYINLMAVKNAGTANMTVDKVFIDLADNSPETIDLTKEEIQENNQDKEFIIDDAITKINFLQEMYERQSTLMEIINWFAIVIAIFGLISSMYAVMLERKFEIGILRSLGMKAKNVRSLFLIESLILLLSSGIMGTFIGVYCAYLLETNLASITEMPVIFSIPIDTLLRVFIISVATGIIGMYFILLKLSKQTIMEIFRQTF
jgi:ABC-type antimicrobial peptide transport system permease subunit